MKRPCAKIIAAATSALLSLSLTATQANTLPLDANRTAVAQSHSPSLHEPCTQHDVARPLTSRFRNIRTPVEEVVNVPMANVNGHAKVTLHSDGAMEIDTSARIDNDMQTDTFEVLNLVILDPSANKFIATLRSSNTGELIHVNTTVAEPQALPALVVLGTIARAGISFAIRKFTATQVKHAAKSFLLNDLRTDKWKHILQTKHLWNSVGARSKEQVADLIGRALTHGRHVKDARGHMNVYYSYRGRTIQVTYDSKTGRISNAWVRR